MASAGSNRGLFSIKAKLGPSEGEQAEYRDVGTFLEALKTNVFIRYVLSFWPVNDEQSKKMRGDFELLVQHPELKSMTHAMDLELHFECSAYKWMATLNTFLHERSTFSTLEMWWHKADQQIDEAIEALMKDMDPSFVEQKFLLNFYEHDNSVLPAGERQPSGGLKFLCAALQHSLPVDYLTLERAFHPDDANWKEIQTAMEGYVSERENLTVIFKNSGDPRSTNYHDDCSETIVRLVESFSTAKKIIFDNFIGAEPVAVKTYFQQRLGAEPSTGAVLRVENSTAKNFFHFVDGTSLHWYTTSNTALLDMARLIGENTIPVAEFAFVDRKEFGIKEAELKKFVEFVANHENLRFLVVPGLEEVDSGARLLDTITARIMADVEQSVERGDSVRYGRMKLMVVGNGQAGKTSTIRSLLNQEFDKHVESTNLADANQEVEVDFHEVSMNNWKGKKVLTKNHLLAAELEEYLKRIRYAKQKPKYDWKAKERPSLLAREKTKKENNVFKNKSIKKGFERAMNVATLRTGEEKIIKEGHTNVVAEYDDTSLASFNIANLSVWDFGGQEVFYSLHHLYLSRGGIYILVFDIEKMLKDPETEKDIIEFWLGSISLHAEGSPVLLVGTRCKEVPSEQLSDISQILEELLTEKKVDFFRYNKLRFVPIDNSSPMDEIKMHLEPLRKQIFKCFNGNNTVVHPDAKVSTRSKENSQDMLWDKRIPFSWMVFMHNIFSQPDNTLPIEKFILESGFKEPEEVIDMIKFYSSVGAVLYFDEPGNESGASNIDMVVIKPQWLLKTLSAFIYDPSLHDINDDLKGNNKFGKILHNYCHTGFLAPELFLELIRRQQLSEEEKKFLLKLCRRMLVISKYPFIPDWAKGLVKTKTIENGALEERTEADLNNKSFEELVAEAKFWMVPAMSREIVSDDDIEEHLDEPGLNLLISWGSFVPLGLFERVVCLFIEKNSAIEGSAAPYITKNFARFWLRKVAIVVVNERKTKSFRIYLYESTSKILALLFQILEEIKPRLEQVLSVGLPAFKIYVESPKETRKDGTRITCEWEQLKASCRNNIDRVNTLPGNFLKNVNIFQPFTTYATSDETLNRTEVPEVDMKTHVLPKVTTTTTPSARKQWRYDCFLAHEWGTQESGFATHQKVVKLANKLREAGFNVWVDENDLQDYVAEEIVEGLVRSACIIVCVTERYLSRCDNPDTNCAKEFKNAAGKGVNHLLPIVLEEKVRDNPWGGKLVNYHLSGKLWIDMSDPENATNFKNVCKRITDCKKLEVPPNAYLAP